MSFLPFKVLRHFPDPSSQILSVLSSEAEAKNFESGLQATSLMPNLCPEMVFSNLPSYAPQILINLSAEHEASHSPFGLNRTAETP